MRIIKCLLCHLEKQHCAKGYCKSCYDINWRNNNKEHVKKINTEYHLKNREKIKLKSKEYYINNKDKIKIYGKEYVRKNQKKIQERNKIYRENNKERKKIIDKNYRIKNAEKLSKQKKIYRENNKEHIRELLKKWGIENKEYRKKKSKEYHLKNKIIRNIKNSEYQKNNRELINKNLRKRYKNDPSFRLIQHLRGRVKDFVKGKGKSISTRELLGCSQEYLLNYLESRFDDSMGWYDYGKNGWHIDHIKPCSSFDLNNISEQKECFHYSNLQPLWAHDNISKGCRV